jgi:hypothetical protein
VWDDSRVGLRRGADPLHRAPRLRLARPNPRPASRYGAHATGRLHRLCPVGPQGVCRVRRTRRPPPPVSSACVLTPSGPSRATRATVPRDAAIRT